MIRNSLNYHTTGKAIFDSSGEEPNQVIARFVEKNHHERYDKVDSNLKISNKSAIKNSIGITNGNGLTIGCFETLNQGPEEDMDSDKATNSAEFDAKTDPNNPVSYPKEKKDDSSGAELNLLLIFIIMIIIIIFIIIFAFFLPKTKKEKASATLPLVRKMPPKNQLREPQNNKTRTLGKQSKPKTQLRIKQPPKGKPRSEPKGEEEEEFECPDCGMALSAAATVCPKCGAEFEEEEQQPEEPPQTIEKPYMPLQKMNCPRCSNIMTFSTSGEIFCIRCRYRPKKEEKE